MCWRRIDGRGRKFWQRVWSWAIVFFRFANCISRLAITHNPAGELIPRLIAKVGSNRLPNLNKYSVFIERTLAMRHGFPPLTDYARKCKISAKPYKKLTRL